jgi:hypothetical protein
LWFGTVASSGETVTHSFAEATYKCQLEAKIHDWSGLDDIPTSAIKYSRESIVAAAQNHDIKKNGLMLSLNLDILYIIYHVEEQKGYRADQPRRNKIEKMNRTSLL